VVGVLTGRDGDWVAVVALDPASVTVAGALARSGAGSKAATLAAAGVGSPGWEAAWTGS